MRSGDVDRAERWLYGQRRALAGWHRNGPSRGTEEMLDCALAGVDALETVGVIGGESAALWRDRLTRSAAGDSLRVEARDDVRTAATELLEELLAAVADDSVWGDANLERFRGAIELLGAIGAVDAAAWDDELRRRTGQPTEAEEFDEIRRLNAGGTEVELVAVIPGPHERRKGHRLIATLRFVDGVSFLMDKDGAPSLEWPDWRLKDDLGNHYMPGGSGGSDSDEHVSFRTPVPTEARWVELMHEQDPEIAFKVAL
jgi:hypothetical protein